MLTFKNSCHSPTKLSEVLEAEDSRKLDEARSEKNKVKVQIEKLESTHLRLLHKLEKQKELKEKVKELNLLCSQQEALVNELKSTLNRQDIKKTLQLREARLEREGLLKKIREMSPPQQVYKKIHKTLTTDFDEKNSPSVRKKSKVINWGEAIPKLQDEVRSLSLQLSESREICRGLKENELRLEEEIIGLYDEIDEKDNSIGLFKEQCDQIEKQLQLKQRNASELERQKNDFYLKKQKSEEVIHSLKNEQFKLQNNQKLFELKICSLANDDLNIKSSRTNKKKSSSKKSVKSKVIKHNKK